MIPIEQKAPPGDRTAAEWNHVAYATRRRRRILLCRILSYFSEFFTYIDFLFCIFYNRGRGKCVKYPNK